VKKMVLSQFETVNLMKSKIKKAAAALAIGPLLAFFSLSQASAQAVGPKIQTALSEIRIAGVTPGEQLILATPSQIQRDPFFREMWAAAKDSTHVAQKTFGRDSAVFMAGLSAVAVRKIVTDPNSNPAAFWDLVATQAMDPFAAASFMVFVSTNGFGNSFLESLGDRFGIVRNPVQYSAFMQELALRKPIPLRFQNAPTNWQDRVAYVKFHDEMRVEAEKLYRQKFRVPRTEATFRLIQRPMALAAAALVSGIFQEFATDKNVMACVEGHFMNETGEELMKYLNDKKMLPFQACEAASRKWLQGGIIGDHFPQMASIASTFLAQTFLINKPVGMGIRGALGLAERYAPAVFRGIQVVRWTTGPVVVGLEMVSNAYVFFELNDVILPLIEDPWVGSRKGTAIVAEWESLVSGDFAPTLSADCEAVLDQLTTADQRRVLHYDQKLELIQREQARPNYRGRPRNRALSACGNMAPSLITRVETFHRNMGEWREFWSRHANESQASWQHYVSRIRSSLYSTESVYHEFVKRISLADVSDPLFVMEPLNGVKGDTDEEKIAALVQSRDYVSNRIDLWRKKTNLVPLEKQALDIFVTLQDLWKSAQAPNDWAKGLLYLEQIKSKDPLFQLDAVRNMGGDPYGFAGLDEFLGKPEFVGRGVAELRRWNDDGSIIDPEFKIDFINIWGRAAFQSKSESILGAAVCGAKIETASFNLNGNPSDVAQRSEAVLGMNLGFWATFLPPSLVDGIGFDPCQKIPSNLSNDHPTFAVHDGRWKIGDRTYTGFLGLLVSHLRPEFRGPQGLANFDRIWEQTVRAQVKVASQKWREGYRQMLAKKLIPLLTTMESQPVWSQARKMNVDLPKSLLGSITFEMELYLYMSRLWAKPEMDSLIKQNRQDFVRAVGLADPARRPGTLRELASDLELKENVDKALIVQDSLDGGHEASQVMSIALKGVEQQLRDRMIARFTKIFNAPKADLTFDAVDGFVAILGQTDQLFTSLNDVIALQIELDATGTDL
jgi:hypothetical protein